MTTKHLRWAMGVGVLAAVTLACNFSFSTAKVEEVKLARDENGEQATRVFLPDETFYLVGKLANAPDDTKLKAVWTAVDAEGQDPNTEIGTKEIKAGSGDFSFKLSNNELWPEGEYEVELSLNDEIQDTYRFEVSATGEHVRLSAAELAADEEKQTEESDQDQEKDNGSGAAASSLDDVKGATIRIDAQGSFVDPEVGLRLNEAGSGSGFIVDESGLAVTNNHVVTGAAIIKVRVDDEDETRRAKVVGVSECSDLAVIDIDGGGFSYLDWYDGTIKPGLDVYAAGFPLDEGEYTLTRGIVSQARANGDSNWAAVDHVIQHDATVNPGNSGGPLVDEDGKVVGINYAANPDTKEYYAISRAEAQDVLDKLEAGDDVTSIGVNGTAVQGDNDLSGIWVSSVKSGSPADEAGIQGGDIITKLEGLQLATDGTMRDYCEILRSHDPSDKLRVEVLRYADQQVLEGQLNGRALEPSFSFAQALESDVAATADSTEAAPEYIAVTDDTDTIVMEVPTSWDDVDGSAWSRDEEDVGVSITASSDAKAFLDGYGTPGVFYGASRMLAEQYDPAALLDELKGDFGVDGCTFEDRYDYKDPFYAGKYEVYKDCGDEKATIIALAATPDDSSYITFLLMQAVSEEDLAALDHVIDTFQTQGDLPE
jgi:serine protease Do